MFNIQHALNINKLFKDFNSQEINQFLVSSQYRTIDYQSEQVITIEGEPLIEIGLVLDGVIEVQKNYPSGKMVVIRTNSKIMFVSKENILKICLQNDKFLKNLLQLLSDKILILDHRLHILSGETIRQKICFYLLERYWEQNTLTIPVNLSRQKMAEQFGITRPSLSRELSRMKREGFIDLDKHTIIIKDLSGLENLW